MKIYRVVLKDGKEEFFKVNNLLELSREININEVQSMELVFEGRKEEVEKKLQELLVELGEEFSIISDICEQASVVISQLNDPVALMSIVKTVEDRFKKLKEIYKKYDELTFEF